MNKENEIEIKFDKRNYRKHSDKNKKVIRKSLEELGAGRSVLIDADGSLIAGNGVYEQAQRLGIPVEVVKTDGKKLVVVQRTDLHEDDDKRKRLALADNSASDTSEFDVELLKEDFDLGELEEFGVDLPEIDVEESEEEKTEKELNPEAEQLLNEAMREYCGEFHDRVSVCMQHGFLPWGKTPAYVKMQFLKAKYYGAPYRRVNSLVFCPRQFMTSAKKLSYYDQLQSSNETGKAGIAGFRSVTGDGDLTKLYSVSYPVGEARMPLDFPAELARDLILRYAQGGRVLDPCHGWGGVWLARCLPNAVSM